MSIRKFTIEYDRMIFGPYPKADIEKISNIKVEIVKLTPFKDKVIFTIDNNKEEDFFAIVYEIGCLAQSILDNRLIE